MLGKIREAFLHLNTLLALVAFGVFCVGALILWFALLDLPDLESFDERIVRQSTKLYDRTGEVLLYDVHENVQRTVVPYGDISRNIKNATVAIEDAEFYEHRGVKLSSTLRAILTNITRADVLSGQGGSTITQQVVKNSLLTPEKKISRKLKEWALALKLEQVYSKEDILTLYLNETPYGGSMYGIEEAAQAFFGKSAKDVSVAEAAYLAALPQAPTYYSPYGDHRDALEARKDLVLERMLEEGFITDAAFVAAAREEVAFEPPRESRIRAPHFVFFVQQYLEGRYGSRALYEDGLRVVTTLDAELQEIGERVALEYALQNEEQFNAENAAIIAVDPETGQILTMVGSRDYFDETIDGNFNVATAHRQPGSSFKPVVYAAAFERGYTPETVVFDLKTQFSTTCAISDQTSAGSCYSPNNYDNTFQGPVTFREALAQSINIPAVKVLYLVGLRDALEMASRLGFRGLTGGPERYGLTLVLGGGEVTPLEMASAYGVFANDGVRNEPTPILSVERVSGEVLEAFEPNPARVLESNVARLVSDVLSDNDARAPAFGQSSFLHFPTRDVAVKTGTTDDYRDAWIVGYTPSSSVAAWAGNNDTAPMEKKVAGFIVAPLWRAFMDEALARLPEELFAPPRGTERDLLPRLRGIWQGGETYLIDTVSGKHATELTPIETQQERVLENVHSILHWVSRDNPLGAPPEHPEENPQYARWEYPVALWALQHGMFSGVRAEDTAPRVFDDVHVEKNMPHITVSGIDSGALYSPSDMLSVRVTSKGTYPLRRVEVYIDGQYAGASDGSPFTVPVALRDFAGKSGVSVRVIGIDKVYSRDEYTTTLSVASEVR